MTREEAIAKGIEVYEAIHSMKRRSFWHDYHRRGTYMLTLVVDGHVPLWGELRGNTGASAELSDRLRWNVRSLVLVS